MRESMPRQYGSLSNRLFSGSVMLWMAVMIFWGMEWLFHMTKPSVLSVLGFTENLTIFKIDCLTVALVHAYLIAVHDTTCELGFHTRVMNL